MDIVHEVFKKSKADFRKLKKYGFSLEKDRFVFVKRMKQENFEARVFIDLKGDVSAAVFDLDLEEEYRTIYSDSQYGAFVSMLRNEFTELLEEIRDRCFVKDPFSFPQSRRINEYIQKQYSCKSEYLWKKYPDYCVYRDPASLKWFAVFMNVDGSKIGLDKKEYEILDVKCDPVMTASLKNEKGFHEAYHMDKEKWLTILLNDTLDDEVICSLIDSSFQLVEKADVWIVPANPKYYDVVGEFQRRDTILWKQSSAVHAGDIVYLYVADPYSAILYKCMAIKTDIPYEYADRNVSMKYVMELKLLKRFPKEKYPFSYLNSLGIRMVRGPRRLKRDIAEKLD